MCGIIGCVAEEPVAGLLLEGLRRVEYRGYDSAGMATIGEGGLEVRKGVGKVAELAERLRFAEMPGRTGMAHCLHPDTLVQLADGRLKRIADMDDEEEVVSLDTATLRIVARKATKSSHPAPRRLLRVTTSSSELVCTEAHRMIVMRDGLVVQAPASELLEGDLSILPRRITTQGESRILAGAQAKRMPAMEMETRAGGPRGGKAPPYAVGELLAVSEADGARNHLQCGEHRPQWGASSQTESVAPGGMGVALVASSRGDGGRDVCFERILSVTTVESGTDTVYDLQVEGTENFLANGIFTHNSRWATHGGVTDWNAHPHASCRERVAVVHNGIIENYLPLKEKLVAKGHKFRSETDTEVISHLLEDEYKRTRDPLKATSAAVKKLRGQYAIVAMFQDRPDVMTGARKDAPLIVGVGDRMMFLASDVLATIGRTDRTIFLDNHEVVEITKDDVRIVGRDGKRVRRDPDKVAWELSDVTKSDYAHFTLKEIYEQPRAVLSASAQSQDKVEAFARAIKNARSLYISASGTSYHAGLLMKYRLNKEAKVRADAVVAGELKEHEEFLGKGSVLVVFSQSGETADVLEAVREAKRLGAKVYSIVNAAGSSLARESDEVLLLNCGPEVGVAATKSFTAQVVVANLVVDTVLGKGRPAGLDGLSKAIEEALKRDGQVRELARRYADRPDFYFVARGYASPMALEGALKLKELSYIHAEGMPASELKHGTLALIEKGTPVVVINPSGPSHAESLSNAEELRARGAEVIGISDKEDGVYEHFIRVPRVQPEFAPVIEAIPLQLLAYHMAVARRNDPDYPRNLAKSVTVK
ncbi:MAG: glutamine--fructose-6-phosphate transaminase (isomerizing) [Nitrososphaerota archaeon]|nr:glutamine--fructose-6-phosphate transaminase (isomerizing) [Nitrososphaerota archaeon]